ncbi:uncharacterized protein [Dysidea avara]|uniref:uncharacterized protein isoform X2 n=1 Tax=Dysidea avara TaxID=196820 RepID=UPI0033196D58
MANHIETQEINTVYPVTDVIPPSYEDVYPSGAPPSYNEALSHHITSAVTYNVNPPVQTEPIAAVRVVPQNSTSWRPQQRSTNRQVAATQRTVIIDNFRVCSIAAIFLCFPIGIVALIYSIKVDYHSNAGRHEAAKMAAKTADISSSSAIKLYYL